MKRYFMTSRIEGRSFAEWSKIDTGVEEDHHGIGIQLSNYESWCEEVACPWIDFE
jgi:hypothetical protein